MRSVLPSIRMLVLLQIWSLPVKDATETSTVGPTVTPVPSLLAGAKYYASPLAEADDTRRISSTGTAVVQASSGDLILSGAGSANHTKQLQDDALRKTSSTVPSTSSVSPSSASHEEGSSKSSSPASSISTTSSMSDLTSPKASATSHVPMRPSSISTQPLSTMASLPFTPSPPSPTDRKIYIKGHLLTRTSLEERVFHPADTKSNGMARHSVIHRTYVRDFRTEPEKLKQALNSSDLAKSRTKKHNSPQTKFYNYKMLYDTLKDQNNLRHRQTEFYAWIFGAAMLTLGTLTTLTACMVFCFCGEKWRARRARRRFDKSGEYQRVDSVSSIVDSSIGGPNDYQDEGIDSVTII